MKPWVNMNSKYSSMKNSDDYKHEFEQMSEEKRNEVIMNPGHVDENLWDKAKKISEESYGEKKWPFIMYMYEKLGGK